MTRQGAERAVTISALVVFGVYFYRLLTEGHSTSGGGGLLQLGGIGAPPNVGRFITGWGFAFLTLAVITEAAPGLGGSLAILVATGDVLGNAKQVTDDVNHKLGADKLPAGGVTVHSGDGGVRIGVQPGSRAIPRQPHGGAAGA